MSYGRPSHHNITFFFIPCYCFAAIAARRRRRSRFPPNLPMAKIPFPAKFSMLKFQKIQFPISHHIHVEDQFSRQICRQRKIQFPAILACSSNSLPAIFTGLPAISPPPPSARRQAGSMQHPAAPYTPQKSMVDHGGRRDGMVL